MRRGRMNVIQFVEDLLIPSLLQYMIDIVLYGRFIPGNRQVCCMGSDMDRAALSACSLAKKNERIFVNGEFIRKILIKFSLLHVVVIISLSSFVISVGVAFLDLCGTLFIFDIWFLYFWALSSISGLSFTNCWASAALECSLLDSLWTDADKFSVETEKLGGRTGKILRPSSVALKSKNQEINRLQLAVVALGNLL
ncbi:hypothetical protein TNCV_797111 [Trichonephila clavipes]|uniref:Uncharacterized protein n=1 Tax=Trichonephila clavipes TaxID=2585209 RepID=A0A8X6WHU2_TRICX|nr:hypothetical protein TNCV_797111 [Trichonephila clavipes]